MSWSTKSLTLLTVFLVGAASLSACKTIDNLATATEDAFGATAELPVTEDFQVWTLDGEGEAAEITAADADLRRVLQSLAARVRGHGAEAITAAWQVYGSETVSLEEPSLAKFKISQAVVFGDIAAVPGTASREIAGVIAFSDSAARQASVSYHVVFDKTLSADGGPVLQLHDPSLTAYFVAQPAVSLFVARLNAVDGNGESVVSNYNRFFSAVTDVALPVRDSKALPAGEADYLYIAFVQSQLAPGDSVQIDYLTQPDQASGDRSGTYYRAYEGGWAVAMLRRTTDLRTEDEGWIKLSLMPDPEGPRDSGATRALGLFAAGSQVNALTAAQAQATGD